MQDDSTSAILHISDEGEIINSGDGKAVEAASVLLQVANSNGTVYYHIEQPADGSPAIIPQELSNVLLSADQTLQIIDEDGVGVTIEEASENLVAINSDLVSSNNDIVSIQAGVQNIDTQQISNNYEKEIVETVPESDNVVETQEYFLTAEAASNVDGVESFIVTEADGNEMTLTGESLRNYLNQFSERNQSSDIINSTETVTVTGFITDTDIHT